MTLKVKVNQAHTHIWKLTFHFLFFIFFIEHVLNASRCIMDILNDEWLNPKGKDDDGILFVLRKMQSRVRSPPPSPLYQDPCTTTTAATNPSPPPPPPPPRFSTDTMTTNHDLCNSSLSLASSSSSSVSSSSSPPSLTTPDTTINTTANNKSSPQQHHAKLSTDILLHRIDMTLSSLEKNLLVNSSATFKTSSRNSSSYTYR
ncbi:unnamed protein product [Absidia cylindrospora]